MSKIPITVCIIAKNEEKHIEECLKHLKKYELEVIVTDTGSTDRTKEIAEKYADKVLDFEWIDDFAAARNYCASFASNNWIIAIDCDEYVTEINVPILRIMMQKFPRHVGVIRLKNIVPGMNGDKEYVSDDVPRMYNKNYYYFKFAIHEQISFIDPTKDNNTMEAFLMPMEVVHHGYALTGDEMLKKQQRNLALLNKSLEEDPTNAYNHFQVGQSYFIVGNLDKAIEAYEKGMNLVDDNSEDNVFVLEMVISLSKAYMAKGRLKDGLALLEKYKGIYSNMAKFNYMYANLLREDQQILKALAMYIKVTTMADIETLGASQMTCYGHIISIYESMGNEQMAELFHNKFLECLKEKDRIISC